MSETPNRICSKCGQDGADYYCAGDISKQYHKGCLPRHVPQDRTMMPRTTELFEMDGRVYLIARDPIRPSGADLTVRYDLSETSIPAMMAEERARMAQMSVPPIPFRVETKEQDGEREQWIAYDGLTCGENDIRHWLVYDNFWPDADSPYLRFEAWMNLAADAYRRDVPALLAVLEAAEAENERLTAQVAVLMEAVQFATVMLGNRAESFRQFCDLAKNRDAEKDRADTAEQMLVDFIAAEREQRERAKALADLVRRTFLHSAGNHHPLKEAAFGLLVECGFGETIFHSTETDRTP